ncbi:DNA damage-inducible protein D [uncultured Selenomonas sp.]|uniref:DNA damage-inducible protein D n=1 Tax=uncultured Selenomonas sp. TaxID=159275 RepID=UPI0028EA4383|nr:DNA damage-inducible protein D [uncultured Selenomonas sp.]
MNDLQPVNEALFENIKHINEYGQEYWSARELMPVLQYAQWRRFNETIERAQEACVSSGNAAPEHFANVGKSSPMPNGGVREVEDYHLSRYACYLVAMNGDPRKRAVALAQTYFAVKTRQQELVENYDALTEDQKRLAIRHEMREHNKALAAAAQEAGVIGSRDYAIFQNEGYKGLYGGLGAQDIHKRKGLKKSQKILDHMGSTELAANLFRATQTEEKLRRDQVRGKENANQTHYDVGCKVRQTIQDLGGTMPENLPTPDQSIQQIERAQKKRLNDAHGKKQ